MAEKYYSLEEVMKKLAKSEDQIRQLVEDGKLQEFREEGNVLYKAEEVDDFSVGEISFEEDFTLDIEGDEGSSIEVPLEPTSAPAEGSGEVELEADDAELEADVAELVSDISSEIDNGEPGSADASSEIDLGGLSGTDVSLEIDLDELGSAGTSAGTTGINVLGDTDDEYKLASDSKGETVGADLEGTGTGAGTGIEDIDLGADINMDSIGSGSGLLDLSLQADDTSLGAVLDDILPAGGDEAEAPLTPEETSMAEEADKIFEEAEPNGAAKQASEQGATLQYFEPPADLLSNACGAMLIIPLLALIYAVIVVFTGLRDISPAMLRAMEKGMYGMATIWIVAGALAVLILLIFGIAAMMGGKKEKVKKKDDIYEQPAK